MTNHQPQRSQLRLQLKKKFGDTPIGISYVPPQRVHAVQGTASCELKSLTVVAAHLLKDEVDYQALVFMVSIQARTVALVLNEKTDVDMGLVSNTVKDAQDRLRHALLFEDKTS